MIHLVVNDGILLPMQYSVNALGQATTRASYTNFRAIVVPHGTHAIAYAIFLESARRRLEDNRTGIFETPDPSASAHAFTGLYHLRLFSPLHK